MATNTSITLTVTLGTKRLSSSGVFGLRETVDVSLSPVASLPGTYSNWRLYLQKNSATVAQCLSFSAGGVGTVDLGTTDMVALFSGKGPKKRERLLCVLWDETADNLIASDYVYVQNNTAPTTAVATTTMGSLVAAENLDAFQVVRIDGDGKAAKVNPAVAASVAAAVGVTTAAASAGASVAIQQHGAVTNASWAWEAGYPVYLNTLGALSQVVPTSGQVLRVGVAQAATILWLTMWPGQNGQKGEKGDEGEGLKGDKGDKGDGGDDSIIPGPKGDAGATWHVTSAVPGADLGDDGDMAFDTADLKYFQKVEGAWVEVASFAVSTATIRDQVLAVLQSSFASLDELVDPTVDDLVTAVNATIAKLKGA